MANSLSDWLAYKVASCIASCEVGRSTDQQDRQSLLGDIAFVKGLQVQILHFFTPHVAQEAHQELLESYHKGLGSQPYRTSSEDAAEDGPLCAIVADKAHKVHVQISRHCVARFNSTHARSLISLRGSIMQIKSFRPSISFLPSLLDNIQRRDGPFAPQPSAIRPVLLLEVESMQVVGAINEVQFWKVKELQMHLLSEDKLTTPFKHWFNQVEKIMRREQRKRLRRMEQEAMDLDGSQSSKRKSIKSSSDSDTISATPASVPMPPPFQRPIQQKRPLQQKSSQQSGSTSSQKSKDGLSKGSWGDFILTQGDDDEFGLEAAASQLIDQHEQGLGSMEEEMMADSLNADAIFPSFSESAFMSERSEQREGAASLSDRQDVNQSQSSKEELSQSSTIPATYPSTSVAQEEQVLQASSASQSGSSFLTPPKVTKSASLSFSLGILPSYPSTEAESQSAEGSQLGPASSAIVAISSTEEISSAANKAPLPFPSMKRELAVQTTLFKDVSMATDPVEEKKPWLQLRGLPTVEELKDRESSFCDRIDLIVD